MNHLRIAAKRLTFAACTVGLVLAATSCARTAQIGPTAFPKAPLVPPQGVVFTQYKAPLDINFGEDGQPTPLSGLSSRSAEANYLYLPLGLGPLTFAWGDASIQAAAGPAIGTVHYADYEVLSVLGVYTSMKTTVYGE